MALPTRPLRDILPLVIPFTPGCPDFTAVVALRMAAITFCERSRIWREILTVTLDEEGEVVATPDHAALHEIEQAFWGPDQIPLDPVRFAATTAVDRDDSVTNGTPLNITQASANTITVFPFSPGDVTIYAILKPLAGPEYGVTGSTTKQDVQNVIPEFIFEQYSQMIANGALARLLMMPKTEWYNPRDAAKYQVEFEMNTAASHNKNISGQHKARRRVRAHWL